MYAALIRGEMLIRWRHLFEAHHLLEKIWHIDLVLVEVDFRQSMCIWVRLCVYNCVYMCV